MIHDGQSPQEPLPQAHLCQVVLSGVQAFEHPGVEHGVCRGFGNAPRPQIVHRRIKLGEEPHLGAGTFQGAEHAFAVHGNAAVLALLEINRCDDQSKTMQGLG